MDMMESVQMTRAKLRKTTKPLLEKKRRARINSSLAQLKTLVLEAVKKDTARYSKLEKADVLDMTVRHLRTMQSQQLAAAMAADPTVLSKFRAGFSECVGEVSRYLSTIDGLEPEVRMRLMEHLATCMERRVIHQVAPPPVNMNMLQQPIHIQIPQATPRATTTLPGHVTSSSTHMTSTASSPPIGSLPPSLQSVTMETAHPLMYPSQAAIQEAMVSGTFHMVPATMLYQNSHHGTPHHMHVKQEPVSISPPHGSTAHRRTPPTSQIKHNTSPLPQQFVTETRVNNHAVVKQEPVWRPW